MTVHAEQITLASVPFTRPPAVHSSTPVAILLSVTLAAHPVRFLERHPLPAREVQDIAIVGVVAIEAPPVLLVMLQHDVVVILDDVFRSA